MNQMRQCGLGFPQYATDHNSMMPPAGWASGSDTSPGFQVSWDSYINRYIGGNASDLDLQQGALFTSDAPKVLACPADRFPKVNWMGGLNPWFALRSYSMVGCGPNNGGTNPDYQRNPSLGLPNITLPGKLSIGIYWAVPAATGGDFEITGFSSSAVRDPSGTILLCENTSGQQCAGNIWTCICNGPQWNANNELYQIDNSGVQDPNIKPSVNQGALLYKAQKGRFNYVFNDGHVECLRIEQTIGSGTLTAPRGMWSMMPGD